MDEEEDVERIDEDHVEHELDEPANHVIHVNNNVLVYEQADSELYSRCDVPLISSTISTTTTTNDHQLATNGQVLTVKIDTATNSSVPLGEQMIRSDSVRSISTISQSIQANQLDVTELTINRVVETKSFQNTFILKNKEQEEYEQKHQEYEEERSDILRSDDFDVPDASGNIACDNSNSITSKYAKQYQQQENIQHQSDSVSEYIAREFRPRMDQMNQFIAESLVKQAQEDSVARQQQYSGHAKEHRQELLWPNTESMELEEHDERFELLKQENLGQFKADNYSIETDNFQKVSSSVIASQTIIHPKMQSENIHSHRTLSDHSARTEVTGIEILTEEISPKSKVTSIYTTSSSSSPASGTDPKRSSTLIVQQGQNEPTIVYSTTSPSTPLNKSFPFNLSIANNCLVPERTNQVMSIVEAVKSNVVDFEIATVTQSGDHKTLLLSQCLNSSDELIRLPNLDQKLSLAQLVESGLLDLEHSTVIDKSQLDVQVPLIDVVAHDLKQHSSSPSSIPLISVIPSNDPKLTEPTDSSPSPLVEPNLVSLKQNVRRQEHDIVHKVRQEIENYLKCLSGLGCLVIECWAGFCGLNVVHVLFVLVGCPACSPLSPLLWALLCCMVLFYSLSFSLPIPE